MTSKSQDGRPVCGNNERQRTSALRTKLLTVAPVIRALAMQIRAPPVHRPSVQLQPGVVQAPQASFP